MIYVRKRGQALHIGWATASRAKMLLDLGFEPLESKHGALSLVEGP